MRLTKASDEQLRAAYGACQSVWQVGAQFGMCGQSVYERLSRIGAIIHRRSFTDQDKAVLTARYDEHATAGTLQVLADEMGRTRHYICRKAADLGLTDRARARPYNDGAAFRCWMATNPHPRGMLGKTHVWSDAEREEIQRKRRITMMARYGKPFIATGANRSWKAGWRVVGDRRIFFRSRWEANYGRYLDWLKHHGAIAEWEHEPETFWFDKIKRGSRSYLPDFRITELDGSVAYHEVKGWMDARSVTKIKRMRIYHKHIKLVVIPKKTYRLIERQVARMIPGWEVAGSSYGIVPESANPLAAFVT